MDELKKLLENAGVTEVISPDQEGYGDMDELLEELGGLLDYRKIDRNELEEIINRYSDMRQPDEFDPYDTDDEEMSDYDKARGKGGVHPGAGSISFQD